MAKLANEKFREHITEKDIEGTLLFKSPDPSNIDEVRKLDDFLKSFLASNATCLEVDGMLEKSQSRVRQVMRHLSKLWKGLEDLKTSRDVVKVPIEGSTTMVEQTVLLVGQASTAISYGQRLNVL